MKYLYLLLLTLFLFSCNNWNENPVLVDNSYDVSGLIYKSGFPQNTSTFYAFKDDNWLLGTSDGCFYKSTDMGKSWAKKGKMTQKDKINSVYAFSIKMGNENKIFILAGTEKGIYVSRDNGESWKDAVIFSGETNEYIKIYFFSYSYDSPKNELTINGYGWDGKNSQFTSVDEGKSWIGTQVYPGKHVASVYMFFGWKEQDISVQARITYVELSGPNISVIKASGSSGNFFIDNNEAFNCFAGGYNGYCYAGTKKGIYRCFIGSSNQWLKVSLKDQNIRSLCRISNEVFYAGTDSGLYYSTDFGFNWIKLILSDKETSINGIIVNKNTIYFLTDSSGVYYSRLPETQGGMIFNPIMMNPPDKSEISGTDITFKWDKFNKNNLENYILQISTSPDFNTSDTESKYLTGVLNYKHYGLIIGNRYYWRMRAYNLFGTTNWPEPFTFTVK